MRCLANKQSGLTTTVKAKVSNKNVVLSKIFVEDVTQLRPH